MFKKIDGPPERKAKYKACCKLKECKNKSRPPDEIEALREEIKDLWEVIEALIES